MRRLFLIVLAAAQIAAIGPPIPVERIPPLPAPVVSAPAWILYDETNDVVLDSRDPDTPRPMASTTKVMTGLLALESGALDEIVTVSQRAADVGEAEIGLVAGERIPLEMLVYSLLLRSANDAAVAVAEHIGGSVEGFVDRMNQRAAELGLDSTAFANPHGLDATGHVSSPRDLLDLARAAMENEHFAEMVGTAAFRIVDAPDGTRRVAESTNTMLQTYRGTFGVKTGFTFQAGLVFVGGAERDGRRLWVVVMGSEGTGGHFVDATRLLDHGFEDLRIVDTIARGTPFRLAATDVAEEVVALARLHALAVVSTLERPPPPPVVEVPDVLTADVAGPREAFGWLWGSLTGG